MRYIRPFNGDDGECISYAKSGKAEDLAYLVNDTLGIFKADDFLSLSRAQSEASANLMLDNGKSFLTYVNIFCPASPVEAMVVLSQPHRGAVFYDPSDDAGNKDFDFDGSIGGCENHGEDGSECSDEENDYKEVAEENTTGRDGQHYYSIPAQSTREIDLSLG